MSFKLTEIDGLHIALDQVALIYHRQDQLVPDGRTILVLRDGTIEAVKTKIADVAALSSEFRILPVAASEQGLHAFVYRPAIKLVRPFKNPDEGCTVELLVKKEDHAFGSVYQVRCTKTADVLRHLA